MHDFEAATASAKFTDQGDVSAKLFIDKGHVAVLMRRAVLECERDLRGSSGAGAVENIL